MQRPPGDDRERDEPEAPSPSNEPPIWPPAPPPPEDVEVALFIIPGPLIPGSTVVDVCRATRRSLPAIAIPAASSSPPEPPAPILPLVDDLHSAESAGESYEVLVADLLAALPVQTPVVPQPDLALHRDEEELSSGRAPDLSLVADEPGAPQVEDVVSAILQFPSEAPAAQSPVVPPTWSVLSGIMTSWGAAALHSGHGLISLGARHLTAALRAARRTVGLGAVRLALVLALVLASGMRSAARGAGRLVLVLASVRQWPALYARRLAAALGAARQTARGRLSEAKRMTVTGLAAIPRPVMPRVQVIHLRHGALLTAAVLAVALLMPSLDRSLPRNRTARLAPVPATESGATPAVLAGRSFGPVARLAQSVIDERSTTFTSPLVIDSVAAASADSRSPARRNSRAAATRADANLSRRVAPATKARPPAVPASEPTVDVRSAAPVSASRSERAAVVTGAETDGIVEALKHLQVAYERRDASLAKAVWPTVNERALARAFDGLRSQRVAFDQCRMNVTGAAGEAECRGTTIYVPRVGAQRARKESHQWKFRLEKGDTSWRITSAAAR